MDKPLEINLSSRTLEMLLKYAKDMVEATAGAWTEPWRANQKAAALRTLAQAEADQLRIVSKGQSDALDNLLGTTTEENKTVELKPTPETTLLRPKDKNDSAISEKH